MQTSRQLQKLKHIRKVKAAIRYQQKTKERLAPIKEKNKDTKSYIVATLRHKHQFIKGDIKGARNNAREDWQLGPLRPNRAIGENAQKYGAIERDQIGRPELPKHWAGAEGWVQKRMKTKIPEHIKRDSWPIVEEDRVVVIRGKEKNKIGSVKEVHRDMNTLIIKDLNKVWVDGSVFRAAPGEEKEAKREWEHAIPYEDVRLVIKRTRTGADGFPVTEDVIVEAVDMAKHTSGENPFTGEIESNIPEEHQVHPDTDEVIWHRYIAGSKEEILWPWEDETTLEQKREGEDRAVAALHETPKKKGILNRMTGMFRRKSNASEQQSGIFSRKTPAAEEEELPDIVSSLPLTPSKQPNRLPLPKPKAREEPDWDDDTTRNEVEVLSETDEFVPTLVSPPLPETLIEELQANHRIVKLRARSEQKKQSPEGPPAKSEMPSITSMLTPLQVKRQLELSQRKEPQPLDAGVLQAIGMVMQQRGKKLEGEALKKYRMQKQEKKTEPRAISLEE